ncbi:hypothetical protein BVC80_8355g6 [Macleaya cordata]|uniref:Reverse transcriptase zinc-binding domain n=1 Tax=Macleaya cordata TaxID=56857 RepID=A0A200PSM9_MACCD|nr:hypothetical protein BVC80_8355g6 [Macleaya cordata]
MVQLHARWLLGDGTTINFWFDRWLSNPIIDIIEVPDNIKKQLTATVNWFIVNGRWSLPRSLCESYPEVVEEIQNLDLPLSPISD